MHQNIGRSAFRRRSLIYVKPPETAIASLWSAVSSTIDALLLAKPVFLHHRRRIQLCGWAGINASRSSRRHDHHDRRTQSLIGIIDVISSSN